MSKFIHIYNFTNNKHSNKNIKKSEESGVRRQRFHSYLYHILFYQQLLLLWLKKTRFNYGYFPTHWLKSLEQVPLPLVIGIDDTWDTKGSHGPVCFYQPYYGSEKVFVLLNSASISVE